MKPAPPSRANGNVRAIRSLYIPNSTGGIKDGPSSKVGDRKSVFKIPVNSVNLKRRNIIQNKTIQRPKDTTHNTFRMSKGLTLRNISRPAQMNPSFLRPSGDIFSTRKTMLERMVRIGERSKNDNPGNHSIVSNPAISKIIACTPKNNALRQVYQKFAESERKSAVKSMAAVAAVGAESPYDQQGIKKNDVQDSTAGNDKNESIIPSVNCIIKNSKKLDMHDDTVTDESKENRLFDTKFPGQKKEPSRKEMLLSPKPNTCTNTDIDVVDVPKNPPCPLNYVKEYQERMSHKDDALISLVGDLERIVTLCGVSAKFWECQKRKREIYRDMEKLEDELEVAARNKVDIQVKFKEYQMRLKGLLKERAEVRDTFKSSVNLILHNYEENISPGMKPFPDMGKILDELSTSKNKKEEETGKQVEVKEKPVLRRSRTLRAAAKVSQVKVKKEVTKSPMCLRSSTRGKVKEDEEFVIKSNKRQIQNSIYRDLQKSFNLCSPESSF